MASKTESTYVEFHPYEDKAKPYFSYKVEMEIERQNFGAAKVWSEFKTYKVTKNTKEIMGKDFDSQWFGEYELYRKEMKIMVDGQHVETWTRNKGFGQCTLFDSFELTWEFKPVRVQFALTPILLLDKGTGKFTKTTEREVGMQTTHREEENKKSLKMGVQIKGLTKIESTFLPKVNISADVRQLFSSASRMTQACDKQVETWQVDTSQGGFYLYSACMVSTFSDGSTATTHSDITVKKNEPVETLPVEFVLATP